MTIMKGVIRVSAELIPQEEGGFTVYCPELDIYTQGETEQECLDNLKEAALLHIEEVGVEQIKIKPVQHRTLELSLSA
jgi:predicted RNase H-like HicB family nuclease